MNDAHDISREPVPKTLDTGTPPVRPGDTLGYARVSTADQNPRAQEARLLEAGAVRVFTDAVLDRLVFGSPSYPP